MSLRPAQWPPLFLPLERLVYREKTGRSVAAGGIDSGPTIPPLIRGRLLRQLSWAREGARRHRPAAPGPTEGVRHHRPAAPARRGGARRHRPVAPAPREGARGRFPRSLERGWRRRRFLRPPLVLGRRVQRLSGSGYWRRRPGRELGPTKASYPPLFKGNL